MDASGHYEQPFCPATQAQMPCVCVSCGHVDQSKQKIAEYPFRFIPSRWSVDAKTQALRCNACTEHSPHLTSFYDENDVLIHEERHPGYNTDEVRFTVTTIRKNVYIEERPMTTSNGFRIAGGTAGEDDEVREDTDMPKIEEDPRATQSRSQRLKDQAGEVGSALGAGLQLAAANEAGEILVDIAKELTSELPAMQNVLDHPDGREIAKVIVAMMLHTGVSQTNVIPQGEFIGRACKLQMTASSFTLLAPRLNSMRKHLTKLAKIGEQAAIANGEQAKTYTQEEMDAAYAEVEAATKLRIAEVEPDVLAEEAVETANVGLKTA